jgi:hypothetical protein
MSGNGNTNPHELLTKFRSRYINGDSIRHRLGDHANVVKQDLSALLEKTLANAKRDGAQVLRQYTHPYPNSIEKFTKLMNDLTAAKASGMERSKGIKLFHDSLNKCSCPKKRTASGRILTSHVCKN